MQASRSARANGLQTRASDVLRWPLKAPRRADAAQDRRLCARRMTITPEVRQNANVPIFRTRDGSRQDSDSQWQEHAVLSQTFQRGMQCHPGFDAGQSNYAARERHRREDLDSLQAIPEAEAASRWNEQMAFRRTSSECITADLEGPEECREQR